MSTSREHLAGPRAPGDVSRRRLLVAGMGTVVGGAAALVAGPAGARAAGSSLLGTAGVVDRPAFTGPDVVGDWFDQITAIPSSYHVPGLTERVWASSRLSALVALEPVTGDPRSSRHGGSFEDAAVATAVHDALVALLPDEAGTFDAALAASLAAIPDGEAKQAGIRAGQNAAARTVDEHDDPPSGEPVTPPPEAPGIYRPPPGSTEPPGTGMALARPFLLGRADRFRPGPPPALGTARYRRDLLEVQRLGEVGSERTEHQSDIAWLAPGRQYTPALRALVRQLARSRRWKVRLLAACPTAAADAGISVADAKRTYWHWRPVTGIRLAHTDGDPLTHPDPSWTSYLMTPANPQWPSGHGGGAGAAEKVLERLTGPRKPVSFTATWSRGDGKIVTREYRRGTQWTTLTQENVDARVWAGVRFRFSDEAGATLGRQVAEHNLRRLGLIPHPVSRRDVLVDRQSQPVTAVGQAVRRPSTRGRRQAPIWPRRGATPVSSSERQSFIASRTSASSSAASTTWATIIPPVGAHPGVALAHPGERLAPHQRERVGEQVGGEQGVLGLVGLGHQVAEQPVVGDPPLRQQVAAALDRREQLLADQRPGRADRL